jgi:ABC-type amino acid transport substrate-binding protein
MLALAGCGLPRDPAGTADRVQNGVLRVGVSEHAPWVLSGTGEPQGIEPALVRAFAAEQHARVQWVRNGETPLLKALEARELDLVVGGIGSDTPWAGKLGLTRPYVEDGKDKRVWLTAPGENRWLLRLDRFLAAHRAEAAARLAAERRP